MGSGQDETEEAMAKTILLSFDWVTLVTVVVVVSVATFVCTVIGKCFLDKFNDNQYKKNNHCKDCRVSFRPSKPEPQVSFEMNDLPQTPPNRTSQFQRNQRNLYQQDSNINLQINRKLNNVKTSNNSSSINNNNIQMTTLNNNVESGTFFRLGIGGSGSGRNMLLPFAKQLENQQLSPIQQTPPAIHRRIGDLPEYRRSSSTFSTPRRMNGSSVVRQSFSSFQGVLGYPPRNDFLTPSPATTATLRKHSKEVSGDSNTADKCIDNPKDNNYGNSNPNSNNDDVFQVLDSEVFSPVGVINGNLKEMEVPRNALSSQLPPSDLETEEISHSRRSTVPITEEEYLTEDPNSEVEKTIQVKAVNRKRGDPGNTTPFPLDTKGKVRAQLVFKETDSSSSTDSDEHHSGSISGTFKWKICEECLRHHRCEKNRNQSCPEPLKEKFLRKQRRSVRQVKQSNMENRQKKHVKQKSTQDYINLSKEYLNVSTSGAFDSMFKLRKKKNSEPSSNRRLLHEFDGDCTISGDYRSFNNIEEDEVQDIFYNSQSKIEDEDVGNEIEGNQETRDCNSSSQNQLQPLSFSNDKF